MAGKPLPRQGSDFSGKDRNPTEIHKSTKVRSNMSIVIIMHRAKARSDAGTVAGTATEQGHFRLSHGN